MSGKCPAGHTLPHKVGGKRCTPLWCGGSVETVDADTLRNAAAEKGGAATKARRKARRKLESKAAEVLASEEDEEVGADPGESPGKSAAAPGKSAPASPRLAAMASEGAVVEMAAGRFAARLSALDVPEGLEGAKAEEFAAKRMVDLLPVAVAELEFALKYGTDAQREKARDRVLDANGYGKKEAGAGGGATIILVGSGGGASLPWSQKRNQLPATDAGGVPTFADAVVVVETPTSATTTSLPTNGKSSGDS